MINEEGREREREIVGGRGNEVMAGEVDACMDGGREVGRDR